MSTQRTFVALPVPVSPALRSLLVRLRTAGRGLRVADAGDLHLTLKFLGATPCEQTADIVAAVDEVAGAHPATSVVLTGVGAFPDPRRPAVIWVGVSPIEPLAAMAHALETRLEGLGFPRELRRFQPHVTLLRVRTRPPADVFQLLLDHPATNFGPLRTSPIQWLRSDLHPSGPRYTLLHEALGPYRHEL